MSIPISRTYQFGSIAIEAFPVDSDIAPGVRLMTGDVPICFSPTEHAEYMDFVQDFVSALVEAGLYVWGDDSDNG